MRAVGAPVARKDGIEKVTGAAKYVDDLRFAGMLHGRTIRSTIPCGKIRSVNFDFDPDGFTVMDWGVHWAERFRTPSLTSERAMSRLRELLEEVHRRSLWQVLLVYIGTGYAILQAADLFIDRTSALAMRRRLSRSSFNIRPCPCASGNGRSRTSST